MITPQVTVVVVPRERFSFTEQSLVNLYEQTTVPFNLVYVSAGAPSPVQRYLEQASETRGFRLIGSTHPLLQTRRATSVCARSRRSMWCF